MHDFLDVWKRFTMMKSLCTGLYGQIIACEVLKICKRRRSLKRVVLFNHTFRKRRLIFQMIFIAEKLLQFLSRLRIKLSLIPKLILSLEKLDAHYFRNEYYLIYVVFICKFQKAYLHWTRAENHLKRFKTRE